MPNELTTTAAATILGISSMNLVEDGTLPAREVGSRTRLLSEDVFAYKQRQQAERRQAFDELRRIEDDLGLVD
ncbi:helix-turn-helix domain-containing protein [Nocardia tenerifensis]|uniref:helix-turn-helix domain-containing protein n=1 Tax=Nocardia tenerifensis TaxID=228006 RepID=UPI0011B5064D|nr:helix-turn-helix domain-containing protein [Nocardia tenerifensis]